jgi:hypothetical protein
MAQSIEILQLSTKTKQTFFFGSDLSVIVIVPVEFAASV